MLISLLMSQFFLDSKLLTVNGIYLFILFIYHVSPNSMLNIKDCAKY